MFELVQIYHDALTSDLKILGLDADKLTLEDLHEEFRMRSFFCVIVVIMITPVVLANPNNALDLDNFDADNIPEGDEFPLVRTYKDDHYRSIVSKYVNYLDKIGYLKYAEETMRHVDERIASAAANYVQQPSKAAKLKPSASTEIAASS